MQDFLLYENVGLNSFPTLMDLLEPDNMSEMFFQKGMEIIDKENETPPDPSLNRQRPKLFREYSPQEMYENFRFSHDEVNHLINDLGIPPMMRIEGRWYHQEEMLIILLRRMTSINRFRDFRKEIRKNLHFLCEYSQNNFGL